MLSALRQRLATLLDLGDCSAATVMPKRRTFKIRLAATVEEKRAAAALVNRRYREKGYAAAVRLDGDEDQVTFIAIADGETMATLTVRFDTEEGLLADSLYRPELDAMRGAGRTVCEITKLAVDESVRSRRVLGALFHIAYLHAGRIRGCTDTVAEVNPSHARFYESLLGFERVGPERMNTRVHAPAILLSKPITEIEERLASFEASATETSPSLYPHGLSPKEENHVFQRLQEAL